MSATTQTPPPAASTLSPVVVLMTAEEFAAVPDDGRHTELVKGVVVEMPPTNFLHGIVCTNIVLLLGGFVRANNLGRVTSNDSGVVTGHDPDTVRGPDVAFFSYARLPADQRPAGYPTVSPDLVFEVRSPTDRWRELSTKALEYLGSGVRVVAVLDPDAGTLTVYEDDSSPRTLKADEEFAAPSVLPGFAVPVRQFLE